MTDERPKRTVRCAACGDVFEPDWTEEEKTREAVETFGLHRPDDETVCHDCYVEFMAWYRTEKPYREN